jgi:hypothetical protein
MLRPYVVLFVSFVVNMFFLFWLRLCRVQLTSRGP